MDAVHNGIDSPHFVAGAAPVLAGVTLLYHNSGNRLTGLYVVCCADGNFIAVARVDMASEPASLGLITASMAAFGVYRRTRRRL